MPLPLSDSCTMLRAATLAHSSLSVSCTPTAKVSPEYSVNAYAWLSVAATQGDSNSQGAKERITRKITRAQIAEAQKRSREYWTRYVVPFQ